MSSSRSSNLDIHTKMDGSKTDTEFRDFKHYYKLIDVFTYNSSGSYVFSISLMEAVTLQRPYVFSISLLEAATRQRPYVFSIRVLEAVTLQRHF